MNRFVIGTLILGAIVSVAENAQPLQRLPVVKTGDMPFYPQLPRIARIEGDVRLRVTTDGSAVTSVRVESGQPMLAKAAQDNVQTWKFEPHDPTSFATLFSYNSSAIPATPTCPTTAGSSLSFAPRWTSVLTFEFGTGTWELTMPLSRKRLLSTAQPQLFAASGSWSSSGESPRLSRGRRANERSYSRPTPSASATRLM